MLAIAMIVALFAAVPSAQEEVENSQEIVLFEDGESAADAECAEECEELVLEDVDAVQEEDSIVEDAVAQKE